MPALPECLAPLLDPAAHEPPVDTVRLIETHISWLLLAGAYAYKIKKPVDLGFLDFSTLERRRFYCAEEVRLNRRLAPEIYIDVAPLYAGPRGMRFKGEGEPVEWAVRMHAFAAEATLDRAANLTSAQIDAIARRIAEFHAHLPPLATPNPFGDPVAVMQPARDNFSHIQRLWPPDDPAQARLQILAAWTEAEFSRLSAHFQRRKDEGHIRECHGDLHLGNIAWVKDAPLIFDALEFSPELRHIDPISEVAFLYMDLLARGEAGLAWRFTDQYLARSGDYLGMAGLRFYATYRAMVRAKIAAIRARQHDDASAAAEFGRYIALADHIAAAPRPALWLMHGFSGSGKSWVAERLVEALGAIRLRSDVERKRIHGLLPETPATQEQSARIYTSAATAATFARLENLADVLLAAGYTAIVDATFLDRALRARFIALAARHGLRAELIAVTAPIERIRQRLMQRGAQGKDPSDADSTVLEAQLARYLPPSPNEGARLHALDSTSADALSRLVAALDAARSESRP